MLPTWDHLWFVVYLLFYSLGLALVFKVFLPRGRTRLPLWCLLVLPGIWLCGPNVLIQEVRPVTWALFNDWANHLCWGGVFAAGVACAGREDFWERVRQGRHWLLVLSAGGLVSRALRQLGANGITALRATSSPVRALDDPGDGGRMNRPDRGLS